MSFVKRITTRLTQNKEEQKNGNQKFDYQSGLYFHKNRCI